ncbi:MAG: hypothetical protein RIR79_1190 [Pseudomonadota bacterium]
MNVCGTKLTKTDNGFGNKYHKAFKMYPSPDVATAPRPRNDTTTQPNPLETTAPNGLRNNAVPDETTLSDRLFQLEQHNNDIFRQAYARAATPQAKEMLLQKFGLKAPPVKGELPDNQRLDSYTDSMGREVRHQANLGVNRTPMSEKDWVAISGGKLQASSARDEVGRTTQTNQSAATDAYNKTLYAQQRKTFGSPGEKAKTREIEEAIGRTEAANQRAYQQQKAVVENMRAKLKDNNALFDDPMLTEEQLRTHPTLREAEYKLEDLAKQLVVKDAKPISDARFDELMGTPLKDNNIDAAERARLMGKFPELTEAETAELTAHAPYLIDSLRLKKKLTPRDEAQLGVANELITHAAREKQRFDKLKPQATDGVKYKRFEQAWADIPDATRDDPFNKALTTSLAPFYPHQHIGAQQHDLPAHALGLRLWVGNGLDTKRPRKGDNGKLYVNPTGHIQGLDRMASVWGSASKARDALQTTYDMMVKEGLIPEDIRPATKARIDSSKLILSQQHYANRELGNLVLQNLKPSELAKIGGGLEGAKSLANQIIRAVNEQSDPDKVFASAVLKSQFEKLFGERAEQTRQAFWLAYKGREQRATDEVIKQSGDGVGEGESGRVESVVGEDLDGNTTMRDMDNAFGKEGDVRTSDDAAWVRGDDTAEFNNTDGDGDVVDSDLAAMTNAMAPTTVAPPKAKFHHQTKEKKVKYDQRDGGTNRRRFHDVYDPGQKKRVSAILESPGFDEARLNSLKEQDDLNNMALPYIKGYEHSFEKSGSVIRHEETLAKAIADIKARGVSDAKAVGYIDYLKEQFGVPDIYDAENPPDSARRFDAAVAKIVKRFSQDSDSPETKLEIANAKNLYANKDWVEKERAKKVGAELVLAEISARRELTDTEKTKVVERANRQFKDFMTTRQDSRIEDIRRKNQPNYDKLLSTGLNPYTKEALDEINSKLFVIKEEAKNDAFNDVGMQIDSSEFASVSHDSSTNYWAVAPGAEGDRSHAAVGSIWLRRASDGKVFMTTADKIVQRARKAMFAAGETQNVKGAKATHDLFLQGLAMLFEPEEATANTKSLVVTKDSTTGKLGVERKGESTNIDANGEGYSTKAGVLPEIGIFTDTLTKYQMRNDLKLSPIDALSIPDSLKIGGTTWGELRKSARERNVADDRTFLRDKQKELDKTLAKLDEKMGRGEALTEIEDFEYGNALKDRDIAKNALRFEALNTKIKALKAKRDRTDVENEAYSAAKAELAKLHEADKERHKALDLEGIEKRIAAQQKVVSDMRNGVVKGGKLLGDGIGEEEAEGLHALYKSHMGKGGNRATGLPALGIDVMRDHPEGIKLRELQKLYDTKYDSTPGTTASLAEAVTHLSKWKDDQQAVYDYDDGAKRVVNAIWDAEYKSIRPFKDETKEAAIARNERRKFNNQKSMLGLVENFHEDAIEHEGGTGVTYTFKPETMVKVLGGGWRALNESRAAKGKPPIDKVTYLQSEMDLVRSLINEPEDAPLWDKYKPHFALPKTDVKKGQWKGVKEQVVGAVNALRDAREVSNMTQQALLEAKANYAQVLADAKTPGSAISEVHVKAFGKNLTDARERFRAGLDDLRKKQDAVKELELTHEHLVEGYNDSVKDRADEIHRLKSGLRSLVGYVDGLVGNSRKGKYFHEKYKNWRVGDKGVFERIGNNSGTTYRFDVLMSIAHFKSVHGIEGEKAFCIKQPKYPIDIAFEVATIFASQQMRWGDRERNYQEETGAALGVRESSAYIKSRADQKALQLARKMAWLNPDFDPANAKCWSEAMLNEWNKEKMKIAADYECNVITPQMVRVLEKGISSFVLKAKKRPPPSKYRIIDWLRRAQVSRSFDFWGGTIDTPNLPTEAGFNLIRKAYLQLTNAYCRG